MSRKNLNGVHIPHRKNTAGMQAIKMPPPATVTIPMSMHIGKPANCIVAVGDHVNVGDVLFTYETDKAEFECESTAAGTLLAKFYEDGDEVPCLANVCAIGNPGDAFEFLKPGAEVPAPAAEAPKAAAPAAAGAPAGPCAQAVIMPKEGITVESCIIGEWKKNVGDPVSAGDVLFTYETDKAEFECESTASGTLLAKFFAAGDEVP